MAATRSRKRVTKKAEIFFSDDIFIEILSRLPAKTALQCRVVCKGWRDLSSTLDFMQLQARHSLDTRRSLPMILVVRAVHKSRSRIIIHNFLLDKGLEPKRRRLVCHRFLLDPQEPGRPFPNAFWAKFSHGGLVVFRNRGGPMAEQVCIREFLILNPTSYENVKITLTEELWRCEIYGIFFNPSLKEFCTLWRLKLGDKVYYKMLNLGSKPCWREISNPWSNRDKVMNTCPVLINEYLYWLVEPEQGYGYRGRGDVVVFDITSENFGSIDWPIPLEVHCEESRISLLDIGGALSFVLTSHNEEEVKVSIWKLKDVEKQLWIPTNHTIMIENCSSSRVSRTTAVAGEKLALWLDERLYVCDLWLGTTSLKMKYNNHDYIVTSSHVMSLASLKDCKSKIYMDIEGEVGEELDMA